MRIGIIGGGQLGMMIAEAAKKMNHNITSLDPLQNASITKFSDLHIAKDYDDEEALEYLYENCDVLTYEFENVNLNLLDSYNDKLPQGTFSLRMSRDRISEKNFARSLGIPIVQFKIIKDVEDIVIPSILKTTTGGYDGKGQSKITEKTQIDQLSLKDDKTYICEEIINFDYEVSVICSRDKEGTIAFFPIPINNHVNGILHTSTIHQPIEKIIRDKAYEYTTKIINALHYVGTMAVEYFVVGEDLIFNEFAPRPHNSGHYTINGCDVSQFDNHVLAITGQKVAFPKQEGYTTMLNVLGQNRDLLDNPCAKNNVEVYSYEKNSSIKNRKIGHININDSNIEEILMTLKSITKE